MKFSETIKPTEKPEHTKEQLISLRTQLEDCLKVIENQTQKITEQELKISEQNSLLTKQDELLSKQNEEMQKNLEISRKERELNAENQKMRGEIMELKAELETLEMALERERRKPPKEIVVTKNVNVPDPKYKKKVFDLSEKNKDLQRENKFLRKVMIVLWSFLTFLAGAGVLGWL